MRRLALIFPTLALCILMPCVFAPTASASQRVNLSVQQCVDMASRNSVQVRNAELDVRAAWLQKQEALAEYFPSVSAMGIGVHAFEPMVDITAKDVLTESDRFADYSDWVGVDLSNLDVNLELKTMQYIYSGSVSLMQPVFAGGRIVNGNRLARLGMKAADVKSSLQKRQSAEDIQKLFYQVLAIQEKQDALKATSRLLDSLYSDVSAAVAAGLALQSDLSAVSLKLSELKAGQSKLRLGLRVAKMNLLNNIGMDYNPYPGIVDASGLVGIDDVVLVGSLWDILSPEDAYVEEEKVANSLDESKLLQMQVDAKKLEKKMTLGSALPSIVFGVSYGYGKMLYNPRWNGAMYAMLQIPITDWGKNARKMQRQQIEVQKAENQRDFLQQQLVLQLRQLYMEVCCAYDQLQIARDAQALAQTRLQQLKSSYDAGMCTLTELLQGENEYRSAQEAQIDASLDYLSALDSYRLRTGN